MLKINVRKKSPTKEFEGLVNYAKNLVETTQEATLTGVFESLKNYSKREQLGFNCHIAYSEGFSGRCYVTLQYGNEGQVNATITQEEAE